MEACDDNTPKRCDTASVHISVIRQNFPPHFLDAPYKVTISEFRKVGDAIFKVGGIKRLGTPYPWWVELEGQGHHEQIRIRVLTTLEFFHGHAHW